MKDHQETHGHFWKYLVENPDGSLNEEAVQKELHDYYTLLKNVPKVYEHVAGLSKPHTDPKHIINHVEENFVLKSILRDDFHTMVSSGAISEDAYKELIEYLK